MSDLVKYKKEMKRELAKELSFSDKGPLVGIFLDKELGTESEENLLRLLEGLESIDVNVVILADNEVKRLSRKKALHMPYNRKNRHRLLAGADIALSFQFNDPEEMLLNGIIPVSLKRPEISDYDPNHETGNSFIYKNEDPWCMFAALVRAIETFKFPYDWRHIVNQGIESVGR